MSDFGAIVRMRNAELYAEQARQYVVVMEDDVTLAARMWKRGQSFPATQLTPDVYGLVKAGAVKGVELVEVDQTEQPRMLVAPPVAVQIDPNTGEFLALPGDAQAVRLAGEAIEPQLIQARAPGVYPIELRAALVAESATREVQRPSARLELAKQYLRAGGVEPLDFPDTAIGTDSEQREVRTVDRVVNQAIEEGRLSRQTGKAFLQDEITNAQEALAPNEGQPRATADMSKRAQDDLGKRLEEQRKLREQTAQARGGEVAPDDQVIAAQDERQRSSAPSTQLPNDEPANIIGQAEQDRIEAEQSEQGGGDQSSQRSRRSTRTTEGSNRE